MSIFVFCFSIQITRLVPVPIVSSENTMSSAPATTFDTAHQDSASQEMHHAQQMNQSMEARLESRPDREELLQMLFTSMMTVNRLVMVLHAKEMRELESRGPARTHSEVVSSQHLYDAHPEENGESDTYGGVARSKIRKDKQGLFYMKGGNRVYLKVDQSREGKRFAASLKLEDDSDEESESEGDSRVRRELRLAHEDARPSRNRAKKESDESEQSEEEKKHQKESRVAKKPAKKESVDRNHKSKNRAKSDDE